MKKSIMMRYFLFLVLTAIALTTFSYPVGALTSTYDVTHNFRVFRSSGLGDFSLIGSAADFAEVYDPNHRKDSVTKSFFITNTGIKRTYTAEVKEDFSPPYPFFGPNSAQANSGFLIYPYNSLSELRGQIQVYGFATTVDPERYFAGSQAVAGILAQGSKDLRSATVDWQPILLAAVGGGTEVGIKDPVSFTVHDLVDNSKTEGTLLDISAQLRGFSSLEWSSEKSSLAINAPLASGNDLSFLIDLTSHFTKQYGFLALDSFSTVESRF